METYNSIEVTRQLVKDGKISQEIAETIFPELKESEDETIRKELVGFIQDEIDSINRLVSGDYDDRDADDIAHQRWCEKVLAWIKKQGEHKPVISDEAIREGVAHFGITQYQINNWLKKYVDVEKQDEKNELRKIEPKFKVGDWVINTITKEVEQVIELTDCEYICSGHLIISFDNQYLLKKWTIEDAKDGDVLKEDSCTFIIERMERNEIAIVHCCLFNDDNFDLGSTVYFDVDSTYPATKEQRDLLFRKMKEAGYEWDAEKKELKKIEQNPTWSEEDKDNLYHINALIKDSSLEVRRQEYLSEWLKSLKERCTWKPSDEQMYAIKHVIDCYHGDYEYIVDALYEDLKQLCDKEKE